MATVARWVAAQRYERGYWERLAQQIARGAAAQLGWYAWRADQLALRLRELGFSRLAEGGGRILEIGSGPVGVVAFFPGNERIAVDPLAGFYAADPTLSALRSPNVQYLEGQGERLPCPSARYDLAIVENCIDHVQDAHSVVTELRRALKPDGVLYLTVNSRTRIGFVVHRVLSRLLLDPGHPHTFTPQRLKALLVGGGFRILSCDPGSYTEARQADLRSSEAKARLKGLLGISEFIVTVVAQRHGGH